MTEKDLALDLFYGVLIDLLTKDPTPELISLSEKGKLVPGTRKKKQ